MDLQSKNAFFGTFCGSIGHIDGLFAIDEMLQMTTLCYDAVGIPIVRFDGGLDLVAFADFSCYFNLRVVGCLTLIDGHFLATLCKDATTFFLVKDAAVSFAKLKICLVAGDDEVGLVFQLATILHTAVAGVGGEFVLECQFEISYLAAFPDKETIAFQRFFGGVFADDGAIDDGPIIGQSFPATKVFAVE